MENSRPLPAATPFLRFSSATGADGVSLSVIETGDAGRPGILFVHAFMQSYMSWEKQLGDAQLREAFHLVAFDLRGHGASGKPGESSSYSSSETWAADVAAVMGATRIRKPVMVVNSFGGRVAMDYIRHHGGEKIAGINLVGARTALGGRPPPPDMNDPEIRFRYQSFDKMAGPDFPASLQATRYFVKHLTAQPLPPAEHESLLIYNMMTPAYVRSAMVGGFAPDNSDLKGRVALPTLVSQGDRDTIILMDEAIENQRCIPGATLSVYEGCAHVPHLEAPARFNRELTEFVLRVNR